MKTPFITLIALILLALPGKCQLDSAAKMQNMIAYMTPGEEHKMMAAMAGDWAYDMTFYMPGAPEMQMSGICTYATIMNGLYQTSTMKGNMMGMPFEGMSVMGFDNGKKKFVSSWIDNMGTGIMMMEGTWDAATKTITLIGTGTDPETFADMKMKQTIKIVDNNTCVEEMYIIKDGKEVKMFDLKMTRKK